MFYGIYDHVNRSHPFQGVLMHDAEQTVKEGPFAKAVTKYVYREVYKKTGLNLDQFLDQERWEIEQLYNILDEYDQKGHKIMKDELSEQQKMLQESKQSSNRKKNKDGLD